MVITGLTRNQFALRGTWVRIPPLPSLLHCTVGTWLGREGAMEKIGEKVFLPSPRFFYFADGWQEESVFDTAWTIWGKGGTDGNLQHRIEESGWGGLGGHGFQYLQSICETVLCAMSYRLLYARPCGTARFARRDGRHRAYRRHGSNGSNRKHRGKPLSIVCAGRRPGRRRW